MKLKLFIKTKNFNTTYKVASSDIGSTNCWVPASNKRPDFHQMAQQYNDNENFNIKNFQLFANLMKNLLQNKVCTYISFENKI